jgi:hypothetical protein
MVATQSDPSEKFFITACPSARLFKIAALCDIDLSAGGYKVPSILFDGLTILLITL